eukprot:s456_g34.t1
MFKNLLNKVGLGELPSSFGYTVGDKVELPFSWNWELHKGQKKSDGSAVSVFMWIKFRFKTGQLLEAAVRDDEGRSQGTMLLEVLQGVSSDTAGHWVLGRYVTASDPHLRWWYESGEGSGLARKAHYHFCEDNSMDCPATRRGRHVHLEKFREISQKELDSKVPGWAFARPCVDALKEYQSRCGGQPTRPEKEGELPWGGSDQESSDEEESSGEKDLKSKLKQARDDLKRLEKRLQERKTTKKKGKEKPKGAKARGRSKDRRDKSPSKKKKRREEEKKRSPAKSRDKKKRKKKEESQDSGEEKKKRRKVKEDDSDSQETSDSSEEQEKLFGEEGSGEEDEKKPRGKKDRGPFGGGAIQRFPGKSDNESESFQDAPADRQASSQLRLTRYAQKMPGRLASRMLQKMLKESAHGSVGAVTKERNPTPSSAVHYLMTVLFPQLGAKLNLRSQRELKTLCTAIDMLAVKQPAHAADVLTQRVKAVERATLDGHWGQAQFLELLSPEQGGLLERDEQVYTSREYLQDMKLRNLDSRWSRGPKDGQKGDREKGGKKGREKGKGKGGTKEKKTEDP